MKFLFEDQPHQAQAIDAVVDLFEGALLPPANVIASEAAGANGHNGFTLDGDTLAKNLEAVTRREQVEVQNALDLRAETDLFEQRREFPNFSVDMETGTGKTFVYIATALRMAQAYGVRKFVILVHSVAIRAGVVKTFQQTRDYFRIKFPNLPYRWNTLGENKALHDFADPSSTIEFLIASVQLLDKPSTNTLYALPEQPRIWGLSLSGIQQVAELRPIVIIDEPQNMNSPLRRRVIATLNPLVALRYSATHIDPYNLVHRLTAKKAAESGLVKRVSVKGILPGSDGRPYIHLKAIKAQKSKGRSPLLAEFIIDTAAGNRQERTTVIVQAGTDLFEKSGLQQYAGFVIDEIKRKPDSVEFANKTLIQVGQTIGVDEGAIWRDQLRQTIRLHIRRQDDIEKTTQKIKVLSLFFVERVADYIGEAASLPSTFDAIYRQEWIRAGKPETQMPDPATLRVHYFPSTKTGIYKDTKGGLASDAELEARAYDEIITNKERLLDCKNPRAFIFSHSALREGWDNPNVFQIGFLRHSRSETERRQQIGRGLRLPVDQDGNRVIDPSINRLTLVIDETFKEFKEGLNQEYVSSTGTGGNTGPDIEDEDALVEIRRRKELFVSPEFVELWKRIRYKAVYRIEKVDESALVAAVSDSEHLEELKDIQRRSNIIESADIIYNDRGQVITSEDTVGESAGERISLVGQRLPNIIRLVEDQLLYGKFPLQLTRPTLSAILKAIPPEYQAGAIHDPNHWARTVAYAIRVVVIEQMVHNITYEPMDEASWWDANIVFVEVERKPAPKGQGGQPAHAGVAPAPVGGVNLYDHVDYDSIVELTFSKLLENSSDHVKLFTKIPRRFKINTPVGEYSPDWAIVYNENGVDRLYLVRETKDTLNLNDLEWDEKKRIEFAKKHFLAATSGEVDYDNTIATSVRFPKSVAGTS